jgi:hypothetical protein
MAKTLTRALRPVAYLPPLAWPQKNHELQEQAPSPVVNFFHVWGMRVPTDLDH